MPGTSLQISQPGRSGPTRFRSLAAIGGRLTTSMLLAALIVTAAACASDTADITSPSSPQNAGSFSAAVTGATTGSTSLSGQAGLVILAAPDTATDPRPESVVLFLQDGTTDAQIGFEWFGTGALTTQTYRIGAADTDVALGYIAADGSVFNGISGSIVISSVANGVVAGAFSGNAIAADTTGRTVSISGTFKALTTRQ